MKAKYVNRAFAVVSGSVGIALVLQSGVAIASWRHSSIAILQKSVNREKRLTQSEIKDIPFAEAGTGTSGVSGIQTRVLKGNPKLAGLYAIQLLVPPNTRIEAHEHPDDRIATVISGDWSLGYGSHFDSSKLKRLPPGSFYTEPSHDPHFAQTGKTSAVVQITGIGPSGTTFVKTTKLEKQ